MAIGNIKTEGELLAFIRAHVEIPPNLQGLLAGGFLKLARTADDKAAYGGSQVTFSGASRFSNQLTVPHGLGAKPSRVWLSDTVNGGGVTYGLNSPSDATNIYVVANAVDGAPPAAGPLGGFDWLAFT